MEGWSSSFLRKTDNLMFALFPIYTVMFVSGRIKTAKTIHYLFSGNHDEDSVDLMK